MLTLALCISTLVAAPIDDDSLMHSKLMDEFYDWRFSDSSDPIIDLDFTPTCEE